MTMIRDYTVNYIINRLSNNGTNLLLTIILAGASFLVVYLIIQRVVNRVKRHIIGNSLTVDTYTQRIAHLIGGIVFTTLMIFNIFIVFEILGINMALIMGGLSLAIGFAMQTTISNMIGGLTLLANKKIKIGDMVELLGKYNFKAKILEFNIRYTVVGTIDKRRIVIPNKELSQTPIKTYKTESIMRGEIVVKVPRHVHLPQVKELLKSTINTHEKVVFPEQTETIITEFDTRGIGLTTYYYLSPQNGGVPFVINSDLRQQLNTVFIKYGIKTPYVHQTVNVEG